jgi:Tat protein secretion system quality control protein TatD with DNase activity
VVEKIAEIKNISEEEVIRATYENACRVYGIFSN